MSSCGLRRSVIISGIVHVALICIAVLAPAARQAPSVAERQELILTFVPEKLVDQPVVSGPASQTQPGSKQPSRSEPVQTLPQTAQRPATTSRSKPQATKPSVQQTQKEKGELSANKVSQAQPISDRSKVSLKPVDRTPSEPARRQDERADRIRQTIDQIAGSLGRRIAESTIEINVPGLGGASYAEYASYVKLVYERAWQPPTMAAGMRRSARAEVVIKRNGDVLSARLIESSGDPLLDQSVQAVLSRIKNVGRPFPEGARDDQRRFIIEFKVKEADSWG